MKTKRKIEDKGEGDDSQLMRDRHGFPVTAARQGLISINQCRLRHDINGTPTR